MNYKWPQTKEKRNLVPWYNVIRRSLFVGPVYFFRGLFVIAVFLGWGSKEAAIVWKNSG